MVYYWIPLVLALLNCFIKNNRLNKAIVVICFLYMMFLSGFRDVSVGTDTNTYVSRFTGGKAINAEMEFVYAWITDLCGNVFSSYTPYLLVLSALFYLPLLSVLLRVFPEKGIKYALLLFVISNNLFFIDSFNSVRQLIATSFLLLSYVNFNRRKYVRFLFYFIIAFGFHNTSLFYFPFFFLSKLDMKASLAKALVGGALTLSLLGGILLPDDILYRMINSITVFGINHYAGYLFMSEYSGGYNVIGLILYVIIPGLVFVMTLREKELSFYEKVFVYGIILFGLLSPFTTISRRACMGLLATELFVFPRAAVGQYKRASLIVKLYFLLYSFYFAYSLVVEFSDPANIGPYSSSWMF